MKLIIDENGRCSGYGGSELVKSGDSKLFETSEQHLNSLVPDGFEGDWKENLDYFKLEGSVIIFDENYEAEGGN